MSQLTDVYVNKEDLGKNLYRKKTYYTLCIEQDCLAKDKDEADKLLLDNGGINHDKINKDLKLCPDTRCHSWCFFHASNPYIG